MLGHPPFGTARTVLPAGREGGSDDVTRSASAHREDDMGLGQPCAQPTSPRTLDAKQIVANYLTFVIPAIFVLAIVWTMFP